MFYGKDKSRPTFIASRTGDLAVRGTSSATLFNSNTEYDRLAVLALQHLALQHLVTTVNHIVV